MHLLNQSPSHLSYPPRRTLHLAKTFGFAQIAHVGLESLKEATAPKVQILQCSYTPLHLHIHNTATSCRSSTFTSALNAGAYQGILRKGGAVFPVPFLSPSSLPFSSLSLLPLEIGPLNQLEGLEERCSGVRGSARPKTNLVHSKAVRKPLVAIILNTLSTMFYSRTIKI